MSQAPSQRSKAVYKHFIGLFGIAPNVFHHYNADESAQVDMIHAVERPDPGLTTYATVSLNESQNLMDGQNVPVELIGVGPSDRPEFGEAVATCALNCITDGWLLAPGVVHEDVLAVYDGLAPHLPHMLVTFPMDWGEQVADIDTPEGQVHALQVMPVSQAEVDFLRERGFDALEEKLRDAEVDYTNLDRPSAL